MNDERLVFDLATAIKQGICWTRSGHVVVLRGVQCGDDKWPIKGDVVGHAIFKDEEWTLEGRFDLGDVISFADLTTIKPFE